MTNKYLIGQIIEDYVKSQGTSYRRYALARDVSELDFVHIRGGKRPATPNKLKLLIDIEMLREPLLEYVKNNINNASTETLISVYNKMYKNLELNDNADSED